MKFLKTIPRASVFTLPLLVAMVATFSLWQVPASAQGRVIASATGSGHITQNGSLRTFAFTAKLYEDGTAQGEAEVLNHVNHRTVHIEVDCLRVAGNRAYIGGRIRNATNSALENQRVLFSVEDNGEGANDPPDRISLVVVLDPEDPTCTDPETNGLIPNRAVERGNIQVR
jgi:hypothetical protein